MADQKEILESIRDIIAKPQTEGDDVLDLTQVVKPDGSVTEIKPKHLAPILMPEVNSAKKEADRDNDILSEIDSILTGDKPNPTPDEKVELEFALKTEKFEISEEFEPNPEGEIAETGEPAAELNPKNTSQTNEQDSKMSNDTGTIISDASAEAAKASITALTDKLKGQGKEANRTEPSAPFRSGATVEDLVVEMLKPMMKDWLDKNLPKLVQEIVQKEIQKLVPKD